MTIHALAVCLCSTAYLLMALCCLCKRDSVASATRMRTERIMATLDMEECGSDAHSIADEDWVPESDR